MKIRKQFYPQTEKFRKQAQGTTTVYLISSVLVAQAMRKAL